MAPRSMNKVLLIGHVGKDPELRYTASGKAVATFTMATSYQWRDQSGHDQEKTEWHRIVAWGRLGEICGEYLSRGKQVFIEGRIQSRDWEDSDGRKRTTFEIIANDLIMLGGGSSQSENRDEHRKQSPQKAASRGQGQPSSGYEDKYYPPPPEDEIPF